MLMTYEGFDACICSRSTDASSHWKNVISWRWVLPVAFPACNKVWQLTNQRRPAPNVSRLRAASSCYPSLHLRRQNSLPPFTPSVATRTAIAASASLPPL